MSSFNRRTLLLMPLALAACGFTPAYGPNGPAKGLQGAIRAADPTDKNAFDFVAQVEQRFGRPQAVRYDLTYTIKTEAVGTGITTDNAFTRYNLTGSIDWTLTDRTTQARVAGGTVQSFTAWSATGTTVAGLAAEEDAARRLMQSLADQIATRIVAASARFAQ